MRPRLARVLAVVGLALLIPTTSAAADPASVTIRKVDGQTVSGGKVKKPVFGRVRVEGTATIPGSGGGETAKSLVADAGDSPLVTAGQPATLTGTGFGGSEPYSFAWTSTAGPISGADAPSAELDTTGLSPGDYTAKLTLTDAAGTKASDTVVVVVGQASDARLVEETFLDPTPGVLSAGAPGMYEFPFDVGPGTTQIVGEIRWTVPTNDYDVALRDPSGTERILVGDFVPDDVETAVLANPEPGTWTLVVHKFATVADEVTATLDATVLHDPRPSVDAGGPYAFTLDAEQRLDGSVTGGTEPVAVGWDTDFDGLLDRDGADVVLDLEEGRHLVSLKATDARGLERRHTTSVLVADADRLAADTTPITVIAIADTGINPYHLEFSAQTYPDPDVLRLTAGFTRHPSEYIPGYPADAKALGITLGQGYLPDQDAPIWSGNETIQAGAVYWIPGTKIIAAIDAGGSTGVTSGEDSHPILDDNGHGSGSASVAAGNRYGYCPTCLLVVVEALDETVAAQFPWVDISSHSFGYIAGAPIGLVVGPNTATRRAAERGQTVLFAAGNGIGNAFDVPVATYGSDQTGPDWNITVGAIRRDNQRAIVGDGIPVHISAWGDGNLPSACRTGTVSQCAFGGTSAATPYTAGVFGTVLTEVRRAVGDGQAGQKPGQVVARGVAIPESAALADGALTRAELREAVLKTALPLNTGNDVSPYPYPLTAPYADASNVLFEGYGAATPEGAKRAIDVLLGRALMPDRSYEDEFFALDRAARDTLYGGYDRDGDGERDFEGLADALDLSGLESVDAAMYALRAVAQKLDADLRQPAGDSILRYYLHRHETCGGSGVNELYMDTENTDGDVEPCYEARITSVAAAFRPLGIWPTSGPIDAPVPAGSDVDVTLFVAQENPTVIRPAGVLMATDRVLGRGEGVPRPVLGSGTGPGSSVQGVALPDGGGCVAMGELCWTRFDFTFPTERHAFTGEQLTFQVEMLGSRAYAFGYEGRHASRIDITVASMPAAGLEFGVTIDEPASGGDVTEGTSVVAGGTYAFPDLGEDPTGAGDHPTTQRVEVTVDDPAFEQAIEATLDEASGTWSAPLGGMSRGAHTLYARAMIDQTSSELAATTFTVVSAAQVEWQVVRRNRPVRADAWRIATGLEDWTFVFDTRDYGDGRHRIVVRVTREGLVLAQRSVQVTFGR